MQLCDSSDSRNAWVLQRRFGLVLFVQGLNLLAIFLISLEFNHLIEPTGLNDLVCQKVVHVLLILARYNHLRTTDQHVNDTSTGETEDDYLVHEGCNLKPNCANIVASQRRLSQASDPSGTFERGATYLKCQSPVPRTPWKISMGGVLV